MADNDTVDNGTLTDYTARDKDRAGVKTQIVGLDLNPNGASEVLQAAAALADATANPTVPAWAACAMLYNGTTWDRMRGDTTNGLDVDVTRLPALPAGTNNIGDVDVLSLPALPAGTNNIGDVDVLTLPSVTQGTPAAQANAWYARPRKLITYRAVFRAAATPWYMSQTTTANTKHQQLTIHHAASATKTVRLRHLWYSIVGNTVSGIGHVMLYRLTSGTTPATGNPAITPSKMSSADAAAEATCLVKPGTAGTEGALISHHVGNIGVAAPATAPSAFMSPMIDLCEMAPDGDDESKSLTIEASTLEGYGVSIEMSSVTTISLVFIAEFTEE